MEIPLEELIFAYLILRQLDMSIITEWGIEQDSTRYPRLAEFIHFLERNPKTFETVERVSGKIAGNSSTSSPTDSKLPNTQR